MSVYGRIVGGDDVRDAVLAFLRRWLPGYLVEVARQAGLPDRTYLPVRSWSVMDDFDVLPEFRPPAIVVTSAGLAGEPVRDAGGRYRATWQVEVTAYVSATDHVNTARAAGATTKAVRAAIVQHRALDGLGAAWWVGETYAEGPSVDLRGNDRGRVGAGQVLLRVEVGDVVDETAGRTDPAVVPDLPEPVPATPDAPTVGDATVTVERSP